MKEIPSTSSPTHNREGLIFGLLGIFCFSLTLPVTKIAVATLDPVVVGLGRALVAAALAAPLLFFTRQKRPLRKHWTGIAVVALGVVVGFPLLSAWAMRRVPASHGAVVVGLLPLVTALFGRLRTHERPSRLFWLAALTGSATVIAFALASGGGNFQSADWALLGAVVLAAMGYTEGARLARELGNWQVICWALLLAAPLLVAPVGLMIWKHGLHASPSAWLCFGYVSLFSMFLGFFAWYRGLAVGGVAKVSQLQLLQPFLTLGFAALLLGEKFGLGAIGAALVVAMSLVVGRRGTITTKHK